MPSAFRLIPRVILATKAIVNKNQQKKVTWERKFWEIRYIGVQQQHIGEKGNFQYKICYAIAAQAKTEDSSAFESCFNYDRGCLQGTKIKC